jgi:acyl-CoA dehydrogenase
VQHAFATTPRGDDYHRRVSAFMDEHVYPAEVPYAEEMRDAGDPFHLSKVLQGLKDVAKAEGLWNLFHPDPEWGPGLTNLEYAPLAELMGRSVLGAEAFNCQPPDTGNIELFTLFGTDEHKERYLRPLLDGSIRSAFAMTEPDVASSDPTNLAVRIERDGDDYVLNGRKWFATGTLHPRCEVLIVMGKTDPEAPRHRQHSMLVVPRDAPGLTVVRSLPIFGYQDLGGHGELLFENVRVPARDILKGEGEGFAISQARLGPGRIHHCMRIIGQAERALDLMCQRAVSRVTFGKPLAERGNIRDWIAESRVEIEMIRLLTLKAAWMMDTVGNKEARMEISAIKVAAPQVALKVIDRAMQVHGAAGVTDDFPLASAFAHIRALRLADGPDEVHKHALARNELKRFHP